MSHPQVLCIMGPTASGKTDLALKLADELPCDLISVDSAMVYRGLDIGTAKPNRITLEKYPHALIDICDPTIPYSGAQFREDALRCIGDALARQRLPVLVGGSMMYHHILQQGIAELPSADPDTRHKLQVWANNAGIEALHDQLQDIDPVAAKRIHPNDQQRIFRALEIFFISGKRLSDYWHEQTLQKPPYTFINIGLDVERHLLRERIAQRFHQMLDNGFMTEVEKLYKTPELHDNLPAIKSVGYAQAWAYYEGKISYDTMVEQIIHITRQCAKRQVTWLRRFPNVHWLDADDKKTLRNIVYYLVK